MVVLLRIELNDPILEFIWMTHLLHKDFTAKDVMNSTSLPYTTVVHRILRYETQGVLIAKGTQEEAIGRPMNLWAVVPEKFQEVVGKVIK